MNWIKNPKKNKNCDTIPAPKCKGVDFRPAMSLAFTVWELINFFTLIISPVLHASNNSRNGSLAITTSKFTDKVRLRLDIFFTFVIMILLALRFGWKKNYSTLKFKKKKQTNNNDYNNINLLLFARGISTVFTMKKKLLYFIQVSIIFYLNVPNFTNNKLFLCNFVCVCVCVFSLSGLGKKTQTPMREKQNVFSKLKFRHFTIFISGLVSFFSFFVFKFIELSFSYPNLHNIMNLYINFISH